MPCRCCISGAGFSEPRWRTVGGGRTGNSNGQYDTRTVQTSSAHRLLEFFSQSQTMAALKWLSIVRASVMHPVIHLQTFQHPYDLWAPVEGPDYLAIAQLGICARRRGVLHASSIAGSFTSGSGGKSTGRAGSCTGGAPGSGTTVCGPSCSACVEY